MLSALSVAASVLVIAVATSTMGTSMIVPVVAQGANMTDGGNATEGNMTAGSDMTGSGTTGTDMTGLPMIPP
jgi:hypothetical protein